MAYDAHKNFAYSTVATAPSPASSGTSLVVSGGDGAKFPAVPFNATVWPTGTQPTTGNAEIVRVTNIATDTFTITRTQESTSARSILVGDQIAATITAKTVTDIEGAAATGSGLTSGAMIIGASGQALQIDSNWTINAQHYLSSSTQPRAVVYHNTTQSLSNGVVTTLNFNSEEVDTASMHDTVVNNSRVTVPTNGDGFYFIVGKASFAENTAGNRIVILLKNGVTELQRSQISGGNASTGGEHTCTAHWMGVLAAADYVELQAVQDSGGALNSSAGGITSRQNRMSVVKLF